VRASELLLEAKIYLWIEEINQGDVFVAVLTTSEQHAVFTARRYAKRGI